MPSRVNLVVVIMIMVAMVAVVIISIMVTRYAQPGKPRKIFHDRLVFIIIININIITNVYIIGHCLCSMFTSKKVERCIGI